MIFAEGPLTSLYLLVPEGRKEGKKVSEREGKKDISHKIQR